MNRLASLLIGLIPLMAFALDFDAALPYSDAAPDQATKVAVGALTEEGVLEGNPDGTFRYSRLLNRAEFMQIAMRLLPRVRPMPLFDSPPLQSCFPDVAADAWFEEPVCLAKSLGIVHGNAREGVDPQFWFFEPSRPLQYEEAVKVLVNIYEIPTPQYFRMPDHWYDPYLDAANSLGLGLGQLTPGHKLTRGEVSRLVARFVAYDEGELDALLRAENRESTEGTSTFVPQGGTIRRGSAAPRRTADREATEESGGSEGAIETESTDAGDQVTYDPDTDLSTKARFIMLGETSPVLGSIQVLNRLEPFDVTKVTVIFTSASSVNSIQALKVYDENGVYLGRANRNASSGNKDYILNMKNGTWVLPKDVQRYLYVRAIVNAYKSGGVSGEIVDVNSITVEGDGYWSHRRYTNGTTENFNTFQTARAVVTSVSNAGDATGVLAPGTDIPVGRYRFEGRRGDGTADLEVTDLEFQIETNDGVTISNVELGADQSTDRAICTVSSSTLICASIPAQIGTFEGGRVLVLYADVSLPANIRTPRLSLTLNQPGSATSAGSVTWTDGETEFSWVPFDIPVARGTVYVW